MLLDLGCMHVILRHSGRRHKQGDSDMSIFKKYGLLWHRRLDQ
ncbi:MAG: hypothetical protein KGJ82_07055 [Nitrospirota bacterium]|nr:hypothetical protein [Nitrospirota bacterium]